MGLEINSTVGTMRPRTLWVAEATLVLGLVLAVPGCKPTDGEINAFVHEREANVSAADYVVQPPDVLEISSSQAAEIDGENQTVRQDGKITLRLLGEVKVAGMTPSEIGQKLETLLSKYYLDPKVNVRISGNHSKRYYVFGDNTVFRQGPFEYTGRDTMLTALAVAQPNNMAWKSQIKLIRPSPDDGKPQSITVDAEKMMHEGHVDQNVLIQEGDIIWVPPTPLAWLGMRIGEALYPVNGAVNAYAVPATVKTTTATFYSANSTIDANK
ncbi:MAG TPA: polysaccharide biosynthesis/export family protein [Phycisphaerae bacterium]|nr:polysaccharide biosynthesis/export family protein [Phycisphaerae bacterium]